MELIIATIEKLISSSPNNTKLQALIEQYLQECLGMTLGLEYLGNQLSTFQGILFNTGIMLISN